MIITYLRSSFLGDWDYCQHSTYIKNTLGIQYPSNQKADMGTIVHKVMDVLANLKLGLQDNKDTFKHVCTEKLSHDAKFKYDINDWLKPDELSSAEIEKINSSRIDKYIYLSPCKLQLGAKRYGVDIVEDIFEKVYSHYTAEHRTTHEWGNKEKQHCLNWTWMALEYKDGLYDPRRKNIFAVEKRFDIVLEYDWAKYDYVLPTGQEISGNLAIKGTIDLITAPEDGILEVVDYKTGQRRNWATGKTKELDDFYKDNQLMLYYYALRKLYPEISHIMLTIFYIRHGGAFSMCFEDKHLTKMESVLRSKFEEIRSCQQPKLLDPSQKDFRCCKLCPFFANSFENDKLNICHRIHQELREFGMEYVTQTRTKENFNVGNYLAPGT